MTKKEEPSAYLIVEESTRVAANHNGEGGGEEMALRSAVRIQNI